MRPRIICHMMSSVDGRLLAERWSPSSTGKSLDEVTEPYFEISRQLNGEAWMIGRQTVQVHYFPKTFEFEKYQPAESFAPFTGKRESERLAIVIDPKGKIWYEGDNLDGDNILTILSTQVSEAYLSLLRDQGISYVFAGPEGEDLNLALETLNEHFGIQTIILEGGGIINGRFLKAGLIDELSLMIYPGIDGLSGIPSIFEYKGSPGEMLSEKVSMELFSTKQVENGIVWLQYKFNWR